MKSLINSFDLQFMGLRERSIKIISDCPENKLYWQPFESKFQFPVNSIGANILRSAGKIEQTFGGITTRLWDDPFEWTMREQLATNHLIIEYLDETEETRKRGFLLFQSDSDLKKEFPAPEKLRSLGSLLLETLSQAENFLGRAEMIAKFL